LVESTWALNVLTILLADNQTILQFKLSQLPGLLECLVDYLRKYLFEIFTLENERDLLGLKDIDGNEENKKEFLTEEIPQIKNVSTLNMKGKFTKTNIKVEINSDDRFVIDKSKLWCEVNKLSASDNLSHIVVGFLQECVKPLSKDVVSPAGSDENNESSLGCTLEEILSVPPSITDLEEISEEKPVKSKIEKALSLNNIVLIESEAVGDEGHVRENWVGATLGKPWKKRQQEVASRAECVMNIVRSLSFLNSNHQVMLKQEKLMRLLSGMMLIRHKHRTLASRSGISSELALKVNNANNPLEAHKINNNYVINEYSWFRSSKNTLAKIPKNTRWVLHKTPSNDKKSESDSVRPVFETEQVYSDTWWWTTVRKMREDAMVTMCNLAQKCEVSELEDEVAYNILDSCLHWTICTSSEAQDPFNAVQSSSNPSLISPQSLSIEILTKLSMRTFNVDFILAIRPYSKIEKMFAFLVKLISERKEPALREFSFVLISNILNAYKDTSRTICKQKSAVSTFITFLEECESNGRNSINMFPSQHQINCGTTNYMMIKCTDILQNLAKLPENRTLFIRHQFRLIELSMSKVLPEKVTKTLSSVLHVLTQTSPTTDDTVES